MKKKTKKKMYQPEFDEQGRVIGHLNQTLFSFLVWKKKKNLLKDYPNCTPVAYEENDIEDPTFMD